MVHSSNSIVQNAMAANGLLKHPTKIIGKCPSDVAAAIRKHDGILDVTEPNDETDRLATFIESKGWMYDYQRNAWVADDSSIRRELKRGAANLISAWANEITDASSIQDRGIAQAYTQAMDALRKLAKIST